MSTIYRHYLVYSRSLGRPNTFLYIAELETIRCRIQISSADEVSPVDVHLRFRKRGPYYGLVHCRPIDETTFVTEAAMLHEDLPRLELVLKDVPEDVADQMRAL